MTQLERCALWFAVGCSLGGLLSSLAWLAWVIVGGAIGLGIYYWIYEEYA